MNCEKYKNIIEQLIDGTISDRQLAELKTHITECESCRDQFDSCLMLQETIKQAFSTPMAAEQAGASIAAKLAAKSSRRLQPAPFITTFSIGRQAAVAAGIVLAVGLFLGFALGRAGTVKTPVASCSEFLEDLSGPGHEGSPELQAFARSVR